MPRHDGRAQAGGQAEAAMAHLRELAGNARRMEQTLAEMAGQINALETSLKSGTN